jgi:hypothetical protein
MGFTWLHCSIKEEMYGLFVSKSNFFFSLFRQSHLMDIQELPSKGQDRSAIRGTREMKGDDM